MPFDLDARRAEARREPKPIIVGGVTYNLPPSLPIGVAEHFAEGRLVAAATELIGDETVARSLDVDDLTWIIEECYGTDLGKRSASSGSSPPNGTRPKLTSRVTTD